MNEMLDRTAKAIMATTLDPVEYEEAVAYASAALVAMRTYLADHYVMDWPIILDEAIK